MTGPSRASFASLRTRRNPWAQRTKPDVSPTEAKGPHDRRAQKVLRQSRTFAPTTIDPVMRQLLKGRLERSNTMKRRTLDIIFSIGGATLAVLVLVLGLVLRSNAVFAQNYVHDQLSQQKITFTPVAGLSPEEAKSAALVKYAGQPLTTGAQAQAYANDYIAGHLAAVNNGKTYAETSGDARAARAAATDAQSKGAANAAQL